MLEWDSAFFAQKTGRCVLESVADWDDKAVRNWDMIYLFANPDDAKLHAFLSEKKILMTDQKITFSLSLSGISRREVSAAVRPYFSSIQDPALTELGIAAGAFSRFKKDPAIGTEKFRALYAEWMRKSVHRILTDEVFVCESARNEIIGVLTLACKEKKAEIGILAVAEAYRGKGTGRHLMQAAINFALEKNASHLQTVTQLDNIGACAFYQNCGFVREKLTIVYHYHQHV